MHSGFLNYFSAPWWQPQHCQYPFLRCYINQRAYAWRFSSLLPFTWVVLEDFYTFQKSLVQSSMLSGFWFMVKILCVVKIKLNLADTPIVYLLLNTTLRKAAIEWCKQRFKNRQRIHDLSTYLTRAIQTGQAVEARFGSEQVQESEWNRTMA